MANFLTTLTGSFLIHCLYHTLNFKIIKTHVKCQSSKHDLNNYDFLFKYDSIFYLLYNNFGGFGPTFFFLFWAWNFPFTLLKILFLNKNKYIYLNLMLKLYLSIRTIVLLLHINFHHALDCIVLLFIFRIMLKYGKRNLLAEVYKQFSVYSQKVLTSNTKSNPKKKKK